MRSFILVYTRVKFTPLARGVALQRAFRPVPGTHIPHILDVAHKQAEKLPLTPKKQQFLVKEYLGVVSFYKNKVPTRFICQGIFKNSTQDEQEKKSTCSFWLKIKMKPCEYPSQVGEERCEPLWWRSLWNVTAVTVFPQVNSSMKLCWGVHCEHAKMGTR